MIFLRLAPNFIALGSIRIQLTVVVAPEFRIWMTNMRIVVND